MHLKHYVTQLRVATTTPKHWSKSGMARAVTCMPSRLALPQPQRLNNWHGQGSSKAEYPDVYVHTHFSENKNEIAWVKSLFPEQNGYLDVYHHYGLTGSRSVFAHCVHLEDSEWDCIHATNSAIAFCPTSNLFLGSGLFPLKKDLGKTGQSRT